jgi:general secretion pathway protein G
MRGMKLTETIGLVVISLLIAATTGCGNKEGKYVGTYVEEDWKAEPADLLGRTRSREVLELKSDGTYTYKDPYGSSQTGDWRVVKSEGQEDIEFTPDVPYSATKSKKRGYYFRDVYGQTILVKEKQARSTQSIERMPDAVQDPISAARVQMSRWESALERFALDVGRYPTMVEGLRALVEKPVSNAEGWDGPYFKSDIPKDPWGNDYIYRYPGDHNRDGYDLYSCGPDRKFGGGDDIDNWSKEEQDRALTASDNVGINGIGNTKQVWIKCRSCNQAYEMGEKDYFEALREKSKSSATAMMFTPPLTCQKCGKNSAFKAEKCPNCGEIFFTNSVPNDLSDRCPKCKHSAIEDARKARLKQQ